MNKINLLIIFFLTIFAIHIGHIPTQDIDLKIASSGYSPIEYVSKELKPENYVRDFPNGIQNYNFSLPMRAYVILKKYFNVEPISTIHLHFCIQSITLFLGLYYLLFSVIKDSIFAFLGVGIIMLSDFSGANLANYFMPLGILSMLNFSLFYAFAMGFGFIALGAVLQNRVKIAVFFLFLSISSHIVMGGFFLLTFLIIGYPILKKHITKRNIGFVFSIDLLGALFLVYNYYKRLGVSDAQTIPSSDWVRAGKVFGYHSFPEVVRVFTGYADYAFIPIIIGFLFFTFLYLNHLILDRIDQRIYLTLVATLIITIVGVLFSYTGIPFLIKLHLHRASSLSSFFLIILSFRVIYVVTFKNKHILNFLFTALFLSLMIASKTIFGILFIFSFGIYFFLKQKNKNHNLSIFIFNLLLMVFCISYFFLIGFSFIQDTDSLSHPMLQYILRNETGFDYLLKGGNWIFSNDKVIYVFLGSITFLTLLKKETQFKATNGESGYYRKIILLILFLLTLPIYLQISIKMKHDNSYYFTPDLTFARDFKEAQIWANKNTKVNDLFLVDPTHSYGWRDFSERSSLGSFRDWAYMFFYDSNFYAYSRGRELMKEFLGFDFYNLSEKDIQNNGYDGGSYYAKEFSNRFYALNEEDFFNLVKKYNFEYIVLKRKNLKLDYNLPIVFQNESIIIYKI